MIIESPIPGQKPVQSAPYCAIRRRKPDGTPNVGRGWIEPMGSSTEFVEDQTKWEVVFYNSGDTLPE